MARAEESSQFDLNGPALIALASVWLALVFSTAAASATVDLPKLRHLSEAQPAQALADGRQLLGGGKLSDDPADAPG